MFSYAYDFTPDVEVTSIDEGYLDLSGNRKNPLTIARTLKDAIHQSLKITVSEGLGSNKLISQIASKLNKPAAFTEVPAGHEEPFLHPLPNRWLPGVGPVMSGRLNAAGLARIGQISATPTDLLELIVGSAAPVLREHAQGRDDRPVIPAKPAAKSYGQQETFLQDQTNESFIEATLRSMADRLMSKVRADGKSVRTVTVKVRYNDMDEDQCSESLLEPTDLETTLYTRISLLLRKAWRRRVSLRLVSLKFSNIYDGGARWNLPLDRPSQQTEARRRLAGVIDELRRDRGYQVVLRGHDFLLRESSPPQARPSTSTSNSNPTSPTARSRPTHSRSIASPNSNSNSSSSTSASSATVASSVKSPESRSPRDSALPLSTSLVRPSTVRPVRTLNPRLKTVPLGVRSHYSFLNSTLSPEAIVQQAVEQQLPVVGLCDQGSLHGAVSFVQAAQKAGIQPVLGAELVQDHQTFWIYVASAAGHARLCRMLSQIPRPGLRPKTSPDPRHSNLSLSHSFFGLEDPQQTEGLLCVSADPRLARWFPGRFYHAIRSPEDLRHLPSTSLPKIVAPAIHYGTSRDRWKYDILQSIRTLTLLRQPHPEKNLEGDFHFPSSAEFQEQFQSIPEALIHTQELAERCRDFRFPLAPP